MCQLYCLPSANLDNLKSLRSVLFKLADVQNREIIILGDTNLLNIDWVNHFLKDTKGTVILELCLQLNLTQWVTEPTRDDNILDIVLSSSTNINQHVQILPPPSNCNHNAVHFLLQNDQSPRHNKSSFISLPVFSRADYDSIRLVLQSIYWPAFFADCRTINDYWLKLLHYFVFSDQ